jgi:hypothetical protein
MRFLVDECTGVVVANWLRRQNYEVFSVYEQARGLDDGQPATVAIPPKMSRVVRNRFIVSPLLRMV